MRELARGDSEGAPPMNNAAGGRSPPVNKGELIIALSKTEPTSQAFDSTQCASFAEPKDGASKKRERRFSTVKEMTNE
jgi:hypothetical protein